MMKTGPKTTTAPIGPDEHHDAFPDARPPGARPMPAPSTAPDDWYRFPPAVRGRLSALLWRVLRDHPGESKARLASIFTVALQGCHRSGADLAGSGDAASQAYAAGLFIRDEVERRQWAAAEAAIRAPEVGGFVIEQAIDRLLEAGSLEETLRDRIARDQATLERLEKMRPAAAAKGTAR